MSTKKADDDLKALAEEAVRQQWQHRQRKARALLDLLTDDTPGQPRGLRTRTTQ